MTPGLGRAGSDGAPLANSYAARFIANGGKPEAIRTLAAGASASRRVGARERDLTKRSEKLLRGVRVDTARVNP